MGDNEPLHSAEAMPGVLRQMVQYDPIRRAVLLEAADHIDALRSRLSPPTREELAKAWDECMAAVEEEANRGFPIDNPYRSSTPEGADR